MIIESQEKKNIKIWTNKENKFNSPKMAKSSSKVFNYMGPSFDEDSSTVLSNASTWHYEYYLPRCNFFIILSVVQHPTFE